MNLNMPRWAWFVIVVCIVLILLVVLKVNFYAGSNGIGVTQSLVK